MTDYERLGIDLIRRKINQVKLTANQMSIMLYLIENPNKIVTREELNNQILEKEKTDHQIDVLIFRIRQRLGKNIIDTVYGCGYRLGKKFQNKIKELHDEDENYCDIDYVSDYVSGELADESCMERVGEKA